MAVSALVFILLVASAVFTSALSGMMGMAGGVLMLAVIVSLVDTAYVVPLHAVVQLVSSSTRLGVYCRYIRWDIVKVFALGLLPGTVAGIFLFNLLPKDVTKLTMGIFILVFTFWPQTRWESRRGYSGVFMPLGFISGALGVVIGTSGPLNAPFFIRQGMEKKELIGTRAACHALSHLLKIPFFGFIGINVFGNGNYRLIIILALATIVGTVLGRRMLTRIDERKFVVAFKVLLVLISSKIVIEQIMKLI